MNKKDLITSRYKHYRNGRIYIMIDFCRIQENGVWVDGVIYCHEMNHKDLFVRSLEEFKIKFIKGY